MSQEHPMAENSPRIPNPEVEEIVRQMTKRFPHASSAQLLDIIRTKHPELEMA
jgi:hypothetical protein